MMLKMRNLLRILSISILILNANGETVPMVCVNGESYCDSAWTSYPNLNAALFGLGQYALYSIVHKNVSKILHSTEVPIFLWHK